MYIVLHHMYIVLQHMYIVLQQYQHMYCTIVPTKLANQNDCTVPFLILKKGSGTAQSFRLANLARIFINLS